MKNGPNFRNLPISCLQLNDTLATSQQVVCRKCIRQNGLSQAKLRFKLIFASHMKIKIALFSLAATKNIV